MIIRLRVVTGELARKGFFLLLVFAIATLLSEGLARVFFPYWAPRTAVVSQFWKYHPSLGWSHIPNSEGSFNPFGSESFISINSKGFRDKERSYERDLSKYRIVVLGDSMVWGYGVQQYEVFTALMEKRRENIEVVNLGVSGYGTDQELILLRQEGDRYRPDLIVVLIHENDFHMNGRESAYLAYQKPMFEMVWPSNIIAGRSGTMAPAIIKNSEVFIYQLSYLTSQAGCQTSFQFQRPGQVQVHSLGPTRRRCFTW